MIMIIINLKNSIELLKGFVTYKEKVCSHIGFILLLIISLWNCCFPHFKIQNTSPYNGPSGLPFVFGSVISLPPSTIFCFVY